MTPLRRNHNVHGAYTLEKGKLTFKTGSASLAQEALRAKKARVDFKICLMSADPISDFVGRVESIELVSGAKPAEWLIVMVEQRSGQPKRN